MDFAKTCVLSIVAAGLVFWAGCEQDERETEAVTGATVQQHNTKMPPKTGEYEVLGYFKGIKGFVVKYDNNLYRGGEILARAGMQRLKDYGVQTIVSIAPTDVGRRLAKDMGLEMVELPFDNGSVGDEILARFLTVVGTKSGPFYVHGQRGNHRAATLCAAYRVHNQGWTYGDALVEFGRLGGSLKEDHQMLEAIRKKQPAAAKVERAGSSHNACAP